MIKGIIGHKNSEFCIIPIIENTEKESQLTERLRNAIICYPRSQAVLVRNQLFFWLKKLKIKNYKLVNL